MSGVQAGTYAVPSDVGWVWLGAEGASELVVSHVPDGPPHVLGSGAAVIWWLAAGRGEEEVVAEIAYSTGQDSAAIGEVVRDFLDTLVSDRLLLHLPAGA